MNDLCRFQTLSHDHLQILRLKSLTLVADETSTNLFNCFSDLGFRFDTAKKSNSLGNSDDIADQITGRNEDYSLGISRANLVNKHMSITCSNYNMLLMWS